MAGHSTPITVYPLAISTSEFFQETRLQVRSTENPSAAQSLHGDIRGLPSQTHKASSTNPRSS